MAPGVRRLSDWVDPHVRGGNVPIMGSKKQRKVDPHVWGS